MTHRRRISKRTGASRAPAVLAAVAAVVLGAVTYAVAEDITMTTSYPSPRGVYLTLDSTGNALLAQTGGTFVGVGMVAPAFELDVNGVLRTDPPNRFIGRGMLPQGAIVMSDGGCPPGWARAGDFDGRVIIGAGGFGFGGGANTHTHDDPGHAHGVGPVLAASTPWGTHGHPGLDHSHSHTVSGGMWGPGGGFTEDCDNCDHWVNWNSHGHGYGFGSDNVGWANPVLVPDSVAGHTHNFVSPGFGSGAAGGTTTADNNWPPYVDIVFCEAP